MLNCPHLLSIQHLLNKRKRNMTFDINNLSRTTNGDRWMIVNFTQEEFLVPGSKKSYTLKRYIGLFEQDDDGYSRWMPEDTISWVSTRDPRTDQLCEFQDVYGYKTFDHYTGFHDKTTYTTEECKKIYRESIVALPQ